MSNVTFLGLGAMGSRMALRLTNAGHRVTVFNRTPDACGPLVAAGARMAETPREAAQGAEFIFGMVTDDDASRELWLDPVKGAFAGAEAGAVVVECSTLTPAWVRVLAGEAAAREIRFIEAPVIGSRPQAEAGQLVILMTAVDAATGSQTKEILGAVGSRVVEVSDRPGDAATLKLAVNALLALQAAGLAELLGFTQKCGLPEAAVAELLTSLPVTSPAAAMLLKGMVARNFAPLFPVTLVEKDLRYALTAAEAAGATLPVIERVREQFAKARDAGFGGDHLSGVAQIYLAPLTPTQP